MCKLVVEFELTGVKELVSGWNWSMLSRMRMRETKLDCLALAKPARLKSCAKLAGVSCEPSQVLSRFSLYPNSMPWTVVLLFLIFLVMRQFFSCFSTSCVEL